MKKNKRNKKTKQIAQAPDLKVIKVTECDNGDAIIQYEVNDAFIDLVKQDLGKNEVSEEDINNWILKVLSKALEEK